MAEDFSGNRTQSLVDAFFHEHDQKLLKEFRQRLEKMDRRTNWPPCAVSTTRRC